MSDLTNRLRGQYPVGPNNLYGTRDFADFIPPISLDAADRIEKLEKWRIEKIDLDVEDFAILDIETTLHAYDLTTQD